jgi:hypothetical protein
MSAQMPLLHWNANDFIGCLEVEPTVDEDLVWHEFAVRRNGVSLNITVRQYESVVHIALAVESWAQPLIELAVFVRDVAIARSEGNDEWLELRDCVLAGSRFSYIEMGDVFDRSQYPSGQHVRIRVKPQIQVAIARG